MKSLLKKDASMCYFADKIAEKLSSKEIKGFVDQLFRASFIRNTRPVFGASILVLTAC